MTPRATSPAREANEDTARLPVRVFVSYASDDRAIATDLRARLRKEGALTWMDEADIRGGDDWKARIDEGLSTAEIVVAVLTRTSVDPARTWIHYEQAEAQRLFRPVIPCLFEDEKPFMAEGLLPPHFGPVDFIDFHSDPEKAFGDLRDAIGQHALRRGKRFPSAAPPGTERFVGRERDLKAVWEMILGDRRKVPTGGRIVAIQGIGGQGKSMLADELARRLDARFPGGVTYLKRGGEMAEAKTSARVVRQGWARRALGESPPMQYGAADLRALLKEGFGQILVLLDDVSRDDFHAVSDLLESFPTDSVRLITTRNAEVREALGADVYPLTGMGEADGLGLMRSRLQGSLGAKLRTTAQREAFKRGLAEVEPHLLELIDAVDGHPLALKLAAGRCKALNELPDILRDLVESLARGGVADFRTSAARTVSPNESLSHSLALSLIELEDTDRKNGTDWTRRFRALGVFPDGSRMSGDFILAVWGDDSPAGARMGEDALDGFYFRSLVDVDPLEGGHTVHPLVRAYAQELLTGAGEDRVEEQQDAQRRYHRFVIERAAEGFRKPQEEWDEFADLYPHIDKVAATVSRMVEDCLGDLESAGGPEGSGRLTPSTDDEAAWQAVRTGQDFARAVREHVIRRPELGLGGVRTLWVGLACARASGDEVDEIEFLKALGGLSSSRDPAQAGAYFQVALDRARSVGDVSQVGDILSYYGELERSRSRWDQAFELLDEALKIHRELNNGLMEAKTLKYRGEVFWRKSLYDDALEDYATARAIYEHEQDLSGAADILNKVGSVNFNRGEHREAIGFFKRALDGHREVGNRRMEAEDLNDMGAAHRYLGELESALGLFEKALAIQLSLGNRRLESITRSNIAGAYVGLSRLDDALETARLAQEIAREVADRIPLVWGLLWEGRALRAQGEAAEAEGPFLAALAPFREEGPDDAALDSPRNLAAVLGDLAFLYAEDLDRPGEAAGPLAEAIGLMETMGFDQVHGGRRLAEFGELAERLG